MPDAPVFLKPTELARRWRVRPGTIYTMIRTGELRATDLSLNRRKPRWRISLAAVMEVEERRRVQPEPKPTRRRRQIEQQNDPGWVNYF